MKIRIFSIILMTAVLAFMPTCEVTEKKKEIPKDELEPEEMIVDLKSAEIIKADRQFAFELLQKVNTQTDKENYMISSLSASYALGMTMNGAAGTTLDAFYDVLHFGDLTNLEVNETYRSLMEQLVKLDDMVEFSIANSIWYRMGYQVLDEFINTNQTYFDAAVRELDFADPGAVDIINDWIEEKTNDKIQDMLDHIPADALMYLINAIYFNATWKYEFDKSKTAEGNFFLEGGGTHRAEFMQVEGTFNYTVTDDFSAVEMPYGDSSFSMVVLLPSGDKTTDDIVGGIGPASWDEWFAGSTSKKVRIELPKFKYGFKALLNEPLIDLGLGVAFSRGADFSRILPDADLFISRVIQQTFIDVQEEGTEAAAVTIVEISFTSVPPGPQIFRADKPFLYFIKENSTGALLFMGKVGKPEYKD